MEKMAHIPRTRIHVYLLPADRALETGWLTAPAAH